MMNTLTSQNNRTNSNKGIKKAAFIVAMAASALLSINASATQEPSLEGAVSDFVVMQGKQIMSELNAQLQQSIDLEVQSLAASLLKHTSLSMSQVDNVVAKELNEDKKNQLAKASKIDK